MTRSRRQWTASGKWAAVALALITAAAWCASGWRPLSWTHDWYSSTPRRWGTASVAYGDLGLTLGASYPNPSRPGETVASVRVTRAELDAAAARPGAAGRPRWIWSIPRILPLSEKWSSSIRIILPLWLVFLGTAGCAGLLWYLDGRYPAGRCRKCGYDLAGNISGVCAECGRTVETT